MATRITTWHMKESLALLLALQHFHVHLEGAVEAIVVYMNHNPLIFINRTRAVATIEMDCKNTWTYTISKERTALLLTHCLEQCKLTSTFKSPIDCKTCSRCYDIFWWLQCLFMLMYFVLIVSTYLVCTWGCIFMGGGVYVMRYVVDAYKIRISNDGCLLYHVVTDKSHITKVCFENGLITIQFRQTIIHLHFTEGHCLPYTQKLCILLCLKLNRVLKLKGHGIHLVHNCSCRVKTCEKMSTMPL